MLERWYFLRKIYVYLELDQTENGKYLQKEQ